MPISPADLREMLRGDAVGIALGMLLTLAGLLTAALIGTLRRRAVPLLWLGTFSLLYGLRLLIRTEIFRLASDLPIAFWERVEAVMTYIVPIPIVFFARAIFPTWQRFWSIGATGLTLFAVYAI